LVLNELSTNAVKYREANTGVSVRVTSLPDCVQIEIINKGRLSATGRVPAERRSAGLELVHALLPASHAELSLGQQGRDVVAQLTLSPPIIKADNQELSAAA
jgi:two-component sensor histidine kinase